MPGGSTATYKYDAFGRRIAKTAESFYSFPDDPNELTKALGVQPKVSQTQHGTQRMVWEPNADTRIRYESHPGDPGVKPKGRD
ncbi:hypothetical protein AB2M95_11380 [Pseudomonas chlororaphis]